MAELKPIRTEKQREYWTLVPLSLHPDYKEGDTQDIIVKTESMNYCYTAGQRKYDYEVSEY